MSNNSCIYIIKNKINNKVYVGRTSNKTKRFSKHKTLLLKNKHPNQYLQNAWNKYGAHNFDFMVHTYADILDLPLLEEQTLKLYHKDMTYNIMNIDQNIHTHAEETKQKLSKATSKNRIGYITPQETKDKIRNTLRKINTNIRNNIIELYNSKKYSQRELARLFNVHQSTIWRIVHDL